MVRGGGGQAIDEQVDGSRARGSRRGVAVLERGAPFDRVGAGLAVVVHRPTDRGRVVAGAGQGYIVYRRGHRVGAPERSELVVPAFHALAAKVHHTGAVVVERGGGQPVDGQV